MPRVLAVLVATLVAIVGLTAVSAQSGPTQPNPPTGGVQPPAVGPPGLSGPYLGAAVTYPHDFRAHWQLYGAGFRPGETVTITAQGITLQPVTVTADPAGNLSPTVDFTWVFCGPSATRHAVPIFHAAGNAGSMASFSPAAPPCPEITAREHFDAPPPGSNGSGVVVGTVVVGTAIAVPGGPLPPGKPPVEVTPQPRPTPTPRLMTFEVDGFGFVPGERVRLQEESSPSVTPPATLTAADGQGRLTATVQAYVPGFCAGTPKPPQLAAAGDKGTAVVAPLYWLAPLIACPATDAPGVPSKSIPSPAPPMATGVLSVAIRSVVVHAGDRERVRVEAPGAGNLHLLVRYPRHGGLTRVVSMAKAGATALSWRVPSRTHRGTAHVEVTFEPGGLLLRSAFHIK